MIVHFYGAFFSSPYHKNGLNASGMLIEVTDRISSKYLRYGSKALLADYNTMLSMFCCHFDFCL